MVLITYLPWHDTFIKFLNVLADIKKSSQNEFQTFLSEAYTKGVPEPGAHLKLHYDRTQQMFQFQRPSQFQLPSIPENVSFIGKFAKRSNLHKEKKIISHA